MEPGSHGPPGQEYPVILLSSPDRCRKTPAKSREFGLSENEPLLQENFQHAGALRITNCLRRIL